MLNKKRYEAMKVTYIYHSCFLVETEVCYYLFDYYKGKLPQLNTKKPVLVCCSHKHEDHYQPLIFTILQERGMEHILAVLSRDITKKGLSVHVPYIEIRGGNTYELPYGQILTAYRSTDKGVAFLIQENDSFIYHSGDLNDWVWEEESDSYNRQMTGSYRKEIDMLAEKMHGCKLDAAFLVLDPRQEQYYDRGLLYFLKKIDCDNIYPMHYWEKPEIIDYFINEHPKYKNRITKIL